MRVECYKCNKFGHYANQCYSNTDIKCYHCNKIGHIRPNCPLLKQRYSFTSSYTRPAQVQYNPQIFSSNNIQIQKTFQDASLQSLYDSFSQQEREEKLEIMKQLDEIFSKPQNKYEGEIQLETFKLKESKDSENISIKLNEEDNLTSKPKKFQKNLEKANKKLENLTQQTQVILVSSSSDLKNTDEQEEQQENQNKFQFDPLDFAKQLLTNNCN
ncbi:hypothetical protein ABPG74_019437 [Tetrahymena malaccensis]